MERLEWKKMKSGKKEMGSSETSEAREREIERTRSQGCYYSCGTGSGGAGESRRIAPRRVVRLGYQMVRTSSRCTAIRTAIPSRARYLPRVQRRGPCRIVRRCRPAAHHSRFTELPRSGRSVWRPEVDRAENIDRPRPEAPCNEARARASEAYGRGNEGTKEHSFAIST